MKEVIENLNELLTMCDFKDEYGEFTYTEPYEKSVDIAIQALETMQELKKRNLTLDDLENYMKFEDECIKRGFTFRSLLEARERDVAIKAHEELDLLDEIEYICGKCGYIIEKSYYGYCPTCGQKIDWSDCER